MATVEIEVERVVSAPAAEVFARLSDIEGHDVWMPRKGSIRRASRRTSDGPVGAGTTYVDDTLFGPTPGEVAEYDPPQRLVYHWWTRTRSGRLLAEGWPGYDLVDQGDGTTLVRHHATLSTHGYYAPATPVLRRIALRERTAVVDALAASFSR